MWIGRVVLILVLVVILGLPILYRPTEESAPKDLGDNDNVLVILTPHNEKIRREIGRAFNRWHQDRHGESVEIDWRFLGSSDILKLLQAEYSVLALKGEEEEGAGYDIAFGGGVYFYNRKLKRGVTVKMPSGESRSVSIIQPIELDAQLVAEAFPTQKIAGKPLYDPDGYWWGVALSSFGIIYNNDGLEIRGVEPPRTWSDLSDPRFYSWVALADPSHSGSIRTTYETIVQRYGWEHGWKTLRRVSANSRYFTSDSSQVPIDVANGEAAAGMCIGFFARNTMQLVGVERVGYVAPVGATVVDPDPIAVLRGAPHRELAIRFVHFLLTMEGQALWNFRCGEEMGPVEFELRRPPIRRDIYDLYLDRMIDKVNPYGIASELPPDAPRYFDILPTVLHAMAIDTHSDLQKAWLAIQEQEDEAVKAKMIELFDAMPFTPEELGQAPARWKKNPRAKTQDRLAWTRFFMKNYRKIATMGG